MSLENRELVINRVIDLPPEKLYRCWVEPELLKQWFAPRPLTTPVAELDVRPGGASLIVMRFPDGKEMPSPGLFLEVIPNEKLVFTDAFTSAWEPSGQAFMTVVLTFEAVAGGKTNYTARVLHWSEADRENHEKMGFYTGWNQCLDQLIEVASGL